MMLVLVRRRCTSCSTGPCWESVDRGLRIRSRRPGPVVAEEDGRAARHATPSPRSSPLDGAVVDQAAVELGPELRCSTVDQLSHIDGARPVRGRRARRSGDAAGCWPGPSTWAATRMVLVVGSSLDSYERARERLAVVLLVASPLMIARRWPAAGWLLAGAALRPVRRMTEQTEEISVNELDRRLAVRAATTRSSTWPRRSTACSIGSSGSVRPRAPLHRRRQPRAAHADLDPARRARAGPGPPRRPRRGGRRACAARSTRPSASGAWPTTSLSLARSRTGELGCTRGRSTSAGRGEPGGPAWSRARPVARRGIGRRRGPTPTGVEQILLNLVTNASSLRRPRWWSRSSRASTGGGPS